MKVLSLSLLLLGTCSAVGQGLVFFRNGGITFPTVADRNVYLQESEYAPPVRLTGTNFVAGLWFLPGPDQGALIDGASQAGWTYTFRPPTTLLPGVWLAGGNDYFTLAGVAPGETATLQVRVWDSVKYSSFAEARVVGEFGVSAPFNYRAPLVNALSPQEYYMDNLRAFIVVPEPSTWALIALAIPSLPWWRKSRSQ